jgi:anti-sigma B factor antagonist
MPWWHWPGEVDLSWSAEVRTAVLAALSAAPRVAVDLAAVSYIDSSGIAALVEGFQNARGKSQPFVLLGVSGPVQAVLKLARLDRVFTLVTALDAAGDA